MLKPVCHPSAASCTLVKRAWNCRKELLKDEPSASEFENNADDVEPEEADQISGGGIGPYAGDYGSQRKRILHSLFEA